MSNKTECQTLVETLAARGHDVRLDQNGCGLRVTSLNESRDISPRLSPKEMCIWLHGYVNGIEELEKKQRHETEER